MSIYHWKLGDIAMARLSKRVYAKVQVVKNDDGLFYDDMVLGIAADGDEIIVTEELCYHVEIIRSKNRLWLPYTSLHLAERSRPFYGPSAKAQDLHTPQKKPPTVVRKRKIIEDHTVPLNVKPVKTKSPDLNTSFENRNMPLKQGKYENAYNEFVRQGKEKIFDDCLSLLNPERDRHILDYVYNVNASTEDKFEMVIKNVMTENEIENYLRQCWRYNFVQKQAEDSPESEQSEPNLPVTIHTSWCLVCGEGDRLRECSNCPSAFHLACRREWLTSIIHRKNPPQKIQKPVTLVEKILSSTRTICSVQKEKEDLELCPSCMWGPRVGYDDIVWHKLGPCPWWPARVLTPGSTPPCLLARTHSPHHWPLRYYGTLNHSWGESRRMSLLLPSHASASCVSRDSEVQAALLDACDDYIAVYLT